MGGERSAARSEQEKESGKQCEVDGNSGRNTYGSSPADSSDDVHLPCSVPVLSVVLSCCAERGLVGWVGRVPSWW